MALCPAGIHPVEHLAPVLSFGTAGTGVEAHQRVVLIVVTGEQGFQAAGFHLLFQHRKALFQLIQHGIIVFFGGHLTDGHHILPGGYHLLVPLDLPFGLLDLNGHLLALLRVIPEAGSLLHGMEPLQLAAHTGHIQRFRQAVQRGAAVIQFLLIGIKFNIHRFTPLYPSQIMVPLQLLHYTEKEWLCKEEKQFFCNRNRIFYGFPGSGTLG